LLAPVRGAMSAGHPATCWCGPIRPGAPNACRPRPRSRRGSGYAPRNLEVIRVNTATSTMRILVSRMARALRGPLAPHHRSQPWRAIGGARTHTNLMVRASR